MQIDHEAILSAAAEARKHGYAPYSGYLVGAALLSKSGEIFTGCNVENASYGLSNCAERTAVFKAVSEGVTTFDAIAIALPNAASPCGACRQVLNEFNPDLPVYIGSEKGVLVRQTTIARLLPEAFGPNDLTK